MNRLGLFFLALTVAATAIGATHHPHKRPAAEARP